MGSQQNVSPAHRIVDLMACLQLPFANLQSGEEVMIVTDTSMDPSIWEAVMAICRQRGAEPAVMMFTTRAHHTAEPPASVAAAMKGTNVCVFLTTMALVHSEFSEHRGNVGCMLMEGSTVGMLTGPACQLTEADLDLIYERELRVNEFWQEGGDVHVTTPAGTDLRAKVEPGPKRTGKPHRMLTWNGGKRASGTWPWGECRVTPLEGTGEGRVVWDLCGYHPEGLYTEPVVLSVEAGRVTKIDGGAEAREVRRYLKEFGDENADAAPAEISVGLNPKAQPMGLQKNDKKILGTAHVAIGRSDVGGSLISAVHFDGIMTQPTISVNGKVFIKDGALQF